MHKSSNSDHSCPRLKSVTAGESMIWWMNPKASPTEEGDVKIRALVEMRMKLLTTIGKSVSPAVVFPWLNNQSLADR